LSLVYYQTPNFSMSKSTKSINRQKIKNNFRRYTNKMAMIIASASLYEDLRNDALAQLEKDELEDQLTEQQVTRATAYFSQQESSTKLSSPTPSSTDSVHSFAVSERHHGVLYFPEDRVGDRSPRSESVSYISGGSPPAPSSRLRGGVSPLRRSPLSNVRPWPETKTTKTTTTIPMISTHDKGDVVHVMSSVAPSWADPIRVVRVEPSTPSPRSAPPRRRPRPSPTTTTTTTTTTSNAVLHSDARHRTLRVIERQSHQNADAASPTSSSMSSPRLPESLLHSHHHHHHHISDSQNQAPPPQQHHQRRPRPRAMSAKTSKDVLSTKESSRTLSYGSVNGGGVASPPRDPVLMLQEKLFERARCVLIFGCRCCLLVVVCWLLVVGCCFFF